MARLRENLDFIAIMVLIVVLGTGHAPRFSRPVREIRMELPGPKFRLNGFHRLVHIIHDLR